MKLGQQWAAGDIQTGLHVMWQNFVFQRFLWNIDPREVVAEIMVNRYARDTD